MTSFQAFLDDMGVMPPGHKIERRNNDGPYAPWNCFWATSAEQQRNTRQTRLTAEQVELIRSSPLSAVALAKQVGVTARHIRKIRQGTRWA